MQNGKWVYWKGSSVHKKKYSKCTGIPYLIKYPNELNIIADCMEKRLRLWYTTSLINCHHKTQGFDEVYKYNFNLAFKILQPRIFKK